MGSGSSKRNPCERFSRICRAGLVIFTVLATSHAMALPYEQTGTGFAVGDGTLIITSAHVVGSRECVRLRSAAGGPTEPARVAVIDPTTDLAVLRISQPREPLVLADWASVAAGDKAFVLGYPHPQIMGYDLKIVEGLVSGLPDRAPELGLFQISAPIQHGNSGGPVLSDQGEVVGVVRARLKLPRAITQSAGDLENVNYAVKSEVLARFIRSAGYIPEIGRGGPAISARHIYQHARPSVVLIEVPLRETRKSDRSKQIAKGC